VVNHRERFAFDETKISNEVIAQERYISAAGNCTTSTSSGTCFTKRRWFYLLYNLSQDDFKLGGSSFAQTLNLGKDAPTIKDAAFKKSLQYDARINS
jgi:phosphoribosylformylglycinamidine synthase